MMNQEVDAKEEKGDDNKDFLLSDNKEFWEWHYPDPRKPYVHLYRSNIPFLLRNLGLLTGLTSILDSATVTESKIHVKHSRAFTDRPFSNTEAFSCQ